MCKAAAPNDAPSHRAVAKILLALLAVLGYEALLHWSAVSALAPAAGPSIALAPVVLSVGWILWRKWRAAGLMSWLVILAASIELLRTGRISLTALYPAPHIAIYLLLLWFFGRTLRTGREPLVTRFARHVHGTLPPEIDRYTRQLTWAWCVFFAGMAVTSLVLFVFAPIAAWSWFANVLNIPLLMLMFVLEYAFRLLRFPDFSHASFFAAIRAARDLRRSALMQGR
jgi:uncharacterized membrane protein